MFFFSIIIVSPLNQSYHSEQIWNQTRVNLKFRRREEKTEMKYGFTRGNSVFPGLGIMGASASPQGLTTGRMVPTWIVLQAGQQDYGDTLQMLQCNHWFARQPLEKLAPCIKPQNKFIQNIASLIWYCAVFRSIEMVCESHFGFSWP